MKKTLFLMMLTLGSALNAQKVFLDENKFPINDTASAKFYEIKESNNISGAHTDHCFYISGEKESEESFIKSKTPTGVVHHGKSISWYKNGRLKSEANYVNGELDGRVLTYYENGQLKSDINYQNKKIQDSIVTWWRNGQLKRKDVYDNGNFKYGNCYDSLGNEIKYFKYEIMPQYKGGDNKLLYDISDYIEYPVNSMNAGIQGRVIVRFVVNTDGSVSGADILEGVSPELNQEALRVVTKLKKFKPGYVDGEPVPVYYMVPINFSLKQ